MKAAQWKSHAELKNMFPTGDYLKNGRYVFNITIVSAFINVVAVVIFIGGVMNIRFIGTHSEYDKVDCSTI